MNIEQLKRNDLEQPANVKYFIDALLGRKFNHGPASLSEILTEAFLSADESFSAQVWFSVLMFIGNSCVEYGDSRRRTQKFSEDGRIQSYIEIIVKIFEIFNKKEITLAFFINHRKWVRKLMLELDDSTKTVLYSFDIYLLERLKKYGYIGFEEILKDEHFKVKTMVEAYTTFLK